MADKIQVCSEIQETLQLGHFRIQGLQQLKEQALAQFDQQITALQQLKENTRVQFEQQIATLQQDLLQLEQVTELLQCPLAVPPPGPVPPECGRIAQRIAEDQRLLQSLSASDPAVPALQADIRSLQQRARQLNCP